MALDKKDFIKINALKEINISVTVGGIVFEENISTTEFSNSPLRDVAGLNYFIGSRVGEFYSKSAIIAYCINDDFQRKILASMIERGLGSVVYESKWYRKCVLIMGEEIDLSDDEFSINSYIHKEIEKMFKVKKLKIVGKSLYFHDSEIFKC